MLDLSFVESDDSKAIDITFSELATSTFPTSNLAILSYCVIRGMMGCGKTTAAWHAIRRVCETDVNMFTPCYLRLENFVQIRNIQEEDSNLKVLATALLGCFTKWETASHGLIPLQELGKLIKSKFGPCILLNIDEFQTSPSLTSKLLLACRETMLTGQYGIHVVPIVSGITDLYSEALASTWQSKTFHLGSLPSDALWTSFIQAVGLPNGTYNNISCLLNDCGGNARQVVVLREKMNFHHPMLHKDLNASDANVVFQSTIERLTSTFAAPRWHAMFSKVYKTGGKMDYHRPSWKLTVDIISQVMLYALSKKQIKSLDDAVLVDDEITWNKCRLTGMVDFVEDGNWYLASCSLMSLLVMNKIAQIIHPTAHLELPFEDDWQTLERVALVSWMVHLQVYPVDSHVLLRECRPGAFFATNETVQLVVPQKFSFEKATTHLEHVTGLEVGVFLLAFPNQHAVDGIVLFDGFVNDQPQQILVLSQSKKRGYTAAGDVADTFLTPAPIISVLEKMKEVISDLPKAVQGAFIVYDVFSDRFAGIRGLKPKSFPLNNNEALFVTTNGDIDQVLGGLVARKREVPN
jgi:hypothetical protein